MRIIYDKRPWGEEEILTMNEKTTAKILTVSPGQQCSLQYHKHRQEFWKVIEGELFVVIGNEKIDARVGNEYFIDTGVQHRLIGRDKPAKILEISFGDFDEEDIVRLEDNYGRVAQ